MIYSLKYAERYLSLLNFGEKSPLRPWTHVLKIRSEALTKQIKVNIKSIEYNDAKTLASQ